MARGLIATSISRHENDRPLFESISLEVLPASVSVVIGPSGAGKSSLMRAMSMVAPPSSGTIALDDETLTSHRTGADSIWPRITLVFQQQFLWPHLSLWENVCLAGQGSKRWREEAAREMLKRLGVDSVLGRRPHMASVGERQRVALVRGAALRPDYLLLYEPTSSLDVETAAIVVTLVREWRASGMGLLVSTHSLGLARSLADRVYFLDRGECVESGTASILEQPLSHRLRQFLLLG